MFASFNSPNETTLISTLTSTGTPLREKKSITVKTNKSKKSGKSMNAASTTYDLS